MNTNQNDRDLIVRFLSGQLSADQQRDVLSRLDSDVSLQEILVAESAAEAAIAEQGSLAGTADADDVTRAVIEEPARGSEGSGILSDDEWRKAIATAVGSPPADNLAAFAHNPFVLALAAAIVLMLFAGMTFFLYRPPAPAISEGPTDIPADRRVYTRITDRTGFLAERGSRARIYEKSDSTATILLSSGNVLLRVEPGRYERFTVATPHSVVTVTGTIVRIVVTEVESEITVYEGSAEVMHQQHRNLLTIASPGETCMADADSLVGSGLVNANLVHRRAHLFREYLGYLGAESNAAIDRRRS